MLLALFISDTCCIRRLQIQKKGVHLRRQKVQRNRVLAVLHLTHHESIIIISNPPQVQEMDFIYGVTILQEAEGA